MLSAARAVLHVAEHEHDAESLQRAETAPPAPTRASSRGAEPEPPVPVERSQSCAIPLRFEICVEDPDDARPTWSDQLHLPTGRRAPAQRPRTPPQPPDCAVLRSGVHPPAHADGDRQRDHHRRRCPRAARPVRERPRLRLVCRGNNGLPHPLHVRVGQRRLVDDRIAALSTSRAARSWLTPLHSHVALARSPPS